jgi:hypothetical protein
MAEDICDEDVLGHVYGFKAVAADSGVGASQVAWFPGKGEGAEGSRNVFGELRAGGGVDGVWGGEALEGVESSSSFTALRGIKLNDPAANLRTSTYAPIVSRTSCR